MTRRPFVHSFLVALLSSAAAGCGGGEAVRTSPPTRVTVAQVERAFAGVGLRLTRVSKADVPALRTELRSKIESRLPGTQLQPRRPLQPGEWLWVVVGDRDSEDEYSAGYGDSMNLETGEVVAEDGGSLYVFHNVAVGFNMRRLSLGERVATAEERLQRAGR